MIKTIKGCLYKAISRTKMNFNDILTLLSDIQEGLMLKATEENDICTEYIRYCGFSCY